MDFARPNITEAARRLVKLGAEKRRIKGGHRKGPAVDLFYDGKTFSALVAPRIRTQNTHGRLSFSAQLLPICKRLIGQRAVLSQEIHHEQFEKGSAVGASYPVQSLHRSLESSVCHAVTYKDHDLRKVMDSRNKRGPRQTHLPPLSICATIRRAARPGSLASQNGRPRLIVDAGTTASAGVITRTDRSGSLRGSYTGSDNNETRPQASRISQLHWASKLRRPFGLLGEQRQKD